MQGAQGEEADYNAFAEDGDIDTAESSNSRSPLSPSYWRSPQFSELVSSSSFFLVSNFGLYFFSSGPHQRSIPFQFLENSGDYVRNLSYNESWNVGDETVSGTALFMVAMVGPFVLQLILSASRGQAGDCHATVCVYLVAFGLNSLATGTIKLYVGYLRPIFYEACQPDDEYQECAANNGGSNWMRMSFPSGHASCSFCGLSLLALFLHTRFGLASVRTFQQERLLSSSQDGTRLVRWNVVYTKQPSFYRLVSMFSVVIFMGLALFIATSRIVDNVHFPADVVGGSAIGASAALIVNSLWFA